MGKENSKDQAKTNAAPPAADEKKKESKPPAELDALRAKIIEYENDLKRLAAEFDNYKKRAEKEKSAARMHGKAEAFAPFIDMAETFEKALEHAEKKDMPAGPNSARPAGDKALHEGIHLLHKKLNSIFAAAGVREIECRGAPNHAFHEVMLQVSGGPAGEIAQVLRKGYVMGEYVLRPAQVAVYMNEEKSEEKKEEKVEEKKNDKGAENNGAANNQ